jgi:CheY-like chemotaxis protein
MMPGMDGIEAAEEIRKLDVEYARTIPIIALTANAVTGMKEMFLEKGFDDYLSKPLEIAKLNEIMEKWIPSEKRVLSQRKMKKQQKRGELKLHIEGVDIKQGIAMTGGTEEGYISVLEQFYADVIARLSLFESIEEGADIFLFATQAHALKSALAVIGAAEISQEAAFLEDAGKRGDVNAAQKALPLFYEHLSLLAKNVHSALKKAQEKPAKKGRVLNAALIPLLTQLKTALQTKSIKLVDALIRELTKIPTGEKNKETINAISDNVLMSDYDEAIAAVNKLLEQR